MGWKIFSQRRNNTLLNVTLLALLLASSLCRAEDKYVIRLFSYSGARGAVLTPSSWGHSFFVALHLKKDATGSWTLAEPPKQISYMPKSDQIRLSQRTPVDAQNLDLGKTFEQAKDRKIGASDFFETSKSFFDSLDEHVSTLVHKMRYRILPDKRINASNCITAIESAVRKTHPDMPPFSSRYLHGAPATQLLLGWMLDGGAIRKETDADLKRSAEAEFDKLYEQNKSRWLPLKARHDYLPPRTPPESIAENPPRRSKAPHLEEAVHQESNP